MTTLRTKRDRAKLRREHSARLRAQNLQPWWKPTPKWCALVGSGLASIAASWILTGAFDDVERGMAATLLVTAVSSWAKSNEGKGG